LVRDNTGLVRDNAGLVRDNAGLVRTWSGARLDRGVVKVWKVLWWGESRAIGGFFEFPMDKDGVGH
jgi:hypothetical protein